MSKRRKLGFTEDRCSKKTSIKSGVEEEQYRKKSDAYRKIWRKVCEQLRPSYIPKSLPTLDIVSQRLQAMLRRTIKHGENSLVLIEGRKGVGKSVLVKHAIGALRRENPAKLVFAEADGYEFTNDKAALKHLNTCIANAFQDERHGTDNRFRKLAGSNEVNQRYFQKALQDGCRGGATVVLVLEHFEVFARRNRQTMLYHLLDLAQHPDTRLAVVCITRRTNSTQQLEKRIRSRFDLSRQIMLSQPSPPLADLKQILEARLIVDADNTRGEGRIGAGSDSSRRIHAECVRLHNEAARKAVAGCDHYLERRRQLGRNTRWFIQAAAGAWGRLGATYHLDRTSASPIPAFLKASALEASMQQQLSQIPDAIPMALEALSEPALALLIAFKRIAERTQADADATAAGKGYNFKMAYAEYLLFVKNERVAQDFAIYSEDEMLRAYLQLIESKLIELVVGANQSAADVQGSSLLRFVPAVLVIYYIGNTLTANIGRVNHCARPLKSWNRRTSV